MVRKIILSALRRGIEESSGTEHKNEETEKRRIAPQVVLAVQHFLSTMAMGMSMGHSAVLLPQLQEEDSEFVVDDETASWIASVYMFISPFGCLVGGVLIDKIGRRTGMIIGGLIFITGWAVIAAAVSPLMLICGRILDGLAVGIITSASSVLFDEMAHPRLRVTVLCLASSIMSTGMLIISLFGAFLHWRTAAGVAAVPTIIQLPILMFVVCETPTYLVKKQRYKDAEKSLSWLWGQHETKVKEELENLKSHLKENEEQREKEDRHNIFFKLRKFVKQYTAPYILKPFLIIHVFNLLQITGGMGLLTFYTVDFLNKVQGTDQVVNANVGTIIISAVKVVGLLLTAYLVYHIGRRPITIISGIGSTIPMLAVAVILYVTYLQDGTTMPPGTIAWTNFILIVIFNAMNTLGFYSLTYTMIGEVLPSKVRGFLFGYISAVNYLGNGGLAKAYPSMLSAMGMHGLFFLFGATNAVCTLFVYLFLPETLNKTLEEIEDCFHQPNIMWISRKTPSETNIVSERL